MRKNCHCNDDHDSLQPNTSSSSVQLQARLLLLARLTLVGFAQLSSAILYCIDRLAMGSYERQLLLCLAHCRRLRVTAISECSERAHSLPPAVNFRFSLACFFARLLVGWLVRRRTRCCQGTSES